MHKVIACEQTWHEAQFAMLTVTIPLRTGQWEEQQYQEVPARAAAQESETTARRLTLTMPVAILWRHQPMGLKICQI